jgi:hypothetical protein
MVRGWYCTTRPTAGGARPPFTFIPHAGFATRVLAYMLDSLVRVSRRVGGHHLVGISGLPPFETSVHAVATGTR